MVAGRFSRGVRAWSHVTPSRHSPVANIAPKQPVAGPGQLNVPTTKDSVFLNLPYDDKFQPLFLGYIAGVSALGMVPHATLEIPGGERRLDRILALMADCRYSVHDLSRVQLDRKSPSTPRFNMPFELGLAVAHSKRIPQHTFYVFEELKHRLSKSLSDLDGTDVYIHGATLNGLFAQLMDAFVRANRQPTVTQMWTIYHKLRRSLPEVLKLSGADTVFRARPFSRLSTFASAVADEVVPA